MILNIIDDLQKVSDNFREWVINHSGPGLMIIFFIIGLAVFFVTYNALHKHD